LEPNKQTFAPFGDRSFGLYGSYGVYSVKQ